MGTDTNLPAIVNLYLELIDRLLKMSNGHDTLSAENKTIVEQVDMK